MKKSIILIAILPLIGLGAGAYYIKQNPGVLDFNKDDQEVASTALDTTETKLNKNVLPSEIEANENLSTFISEKYKYSFRYPESYDVLASWDSGLPRQEEMENSRYVLVAPPKSFSRQEVFSIEILEKEPLKEFSQKIWELQKQSTSAEVGELSETTIDNRPAYRFTLNGSYQSDTLSYLFNQKRYYIITEGDESLFIIYFPANNPISEQIFESFKLN